MMTELDAAAQLAAISQWVDDAPENLARDPEARRWGRLAKVAEEAGEVISAFIGATGQNPRKGVCASEAEVVKELMDVAVTALCAAEHMTGNHGQSLGLLFEHILFLHKRAQDVVAREAAR